MWMRVTSSSLLPITYVNGIGVANFNTYIASAARVSKRQSRRSAACSLAWRYGRKVEKMATNYSTARAVELRALTALFTNREDADSAYEWLLKNGYNSNDIHLLMSEETRQKYHYAVAVEPETTDEDAVAGLEAGAVVGGGLGATLGVVAAIGAAVIIPGMGLAVAGPLAASLAGAGGLVGGVLGALYGSSVPEEEAHKLEQKIREGSILIKVYPYDDEDAAQIESEWRERGGEMVHY